MTVFVTLLYVYHVQSLHAHCVILRYCMFIMDRACTPTVLFHVIVCLSCTEPARPLCYFTLLYVYHLQSLHAHSQFCMSGDHTLEATEHAIKTITNEEADEHFVICLSDANLARYGISPKSFSNVLTSNDDVNAYVIFIGSLGDQANRSVWVLLFKGNFFQTPPKL